MPCEADWQITHDQEESRSLADLVKQKDDAIKELKSAIDSTGLRCDKLENKEEEHLKVTFI